jgi:hypothetical protein
VAPPPGRTRTNPKARGGRARVPDAAASRPRGKAPPPRHAGAAAGSRPSVVAALRSRGPVLLMVVAGAAAARRGRRRCARRVVGERLPVSPGRGAQHHGIGVAATHRCRVRACLVLVSGATAESPLRPAAPPRPAASAGQALAASSISTVPCPCAATRRAVSRSLVARWGLEILARTASPPIRVSGPGTWPWTMVMASTSRSLSGPTSSRLGGVLPRHGSTALTGHGAATLGVVGGAEHEPRVAHHLQRWAPTSPDRVHHRTATCRRTAGQSVGTVR